MGEGGEAINRLATDIPAMAGQERKHMLTFDDDPAPTLPAMAPRTAETIRAQVLGSIGAGALSQEPVQEMDVERETSSENFHRVRLEDKRVINGAADVNQLVPFKYRWA